MKLKQDIESPLSIAVDSSGRVGSVAIGQGETILGHKIFSDKMMHSSEMFPALEHLLFENKFSPKDIKNIFLTIGPGSFTGLRISAVAAKMMYLANNIKICTVGTLDAIAENITPEYNLQIAVIVDAKRGKFFAAAYECQDGKWTKTVEDCLVSSDDFLKKIGDRKTLFLGEGLVYYKNNFKKPNVEFADEKLWTVNSQNVYRLGYAKYKKSEFADPVSLVPEYLRNPI